MLWGSGLTGFLFCRARGVMQVEADAGLSAPPAASLAAASDEPHFCAACLQLHVHHPLRPTPRPRFRAEPIRVSTGHHPRASKHSQRCAHPQS